MSEKLTITAPLTDTVTISRETYDVLVKAYRAHIAHMYEAAAQAGVPKLAPEQYPELEK